MLFPLFLRVVGIKIIPIISILLSALVTTSAMRSEARVIIETLRGGNKKGLDLLPPLTILQ